MSDVRQKRGKLPIVEARSYVGSLLGTAVGDALGLPREGLSSRRAERLFGKSDDHGLLFGRGMVSDDTEHACFVARALIECGYDPERFQRRLARSLRWWLAGVPAGIGFATLRAILRLWIGVPSCRSGVFSAGNGPAMRSPLLGLLHGDNHETLRQYVRRSTEITHSDPKAFFGAMAVAVAAHYSATAHRVSGQAYLDHLRESVPEAEAVELHTLLERAVESANRGEDVGAFAARIGSRNGITGYMYHTVPCVVQTWLRYHDDYAGAIRTIIEAGGDTDTTGAILGAIVGARTGKTQIPAQWLEGIVEWPRSIQWIEHLAETVAEVAEGKSSTPVPAYFFAGMPLRNLVFAIVVLTHGFRRLAPPY